MKSTNNSILLTGPSGSLAINKKDKLSLKIAMVVENMCLGLKAEQAALKYGFSRSHFFDIKAKFKKGGSESLIGEKQGPKTNYVRTENVVNQIIRLRFLDPEISVDVITQKLKQFGFDVSKRSVERTITEYGIQKKTSHIKSS